MIRFAFVAILAGATTPAPAHSVDFWKQIARNQYAVPPGASVSDLTAELTEMLASPDPELRDGIAYSTLAAWIYQTRALEGHTLGTLVTTLLGNLTAGIGESGTDGIFRRSFSALTLGTVVARDNAAPCLTVDDFHRIERAALAYLRDERDLRGYDPDRGWMHSAAHTADLLKFIGRSRFLAVDAQARLLDAIGEKLRTADIVFTHGEDERFARAVLSIVSRADFDGRGFAEWTTRVKPARPADKPSVGELRRLQNAKNLLAKLDVLLDAVPQPSEAVRSAHESVRASLKDAF
jgi:Protein of unknown function (DUF2785)